MVELIASLDKEVTNYEKRVINLDKQIELLEETLANLRKHLENHDQQFRMVEETTINLNKQVTNDDYEEHDKALIELRMKVEKLGESMASDLKELNL